MSSFAVVASFKKRIVSNKDAQLEVVKGKQVEIGTHRYKYIDTTRFFKSYEGLMDLMDSTGLQAHRIISYVMRQVLEAKSGHMVFCFDNKSVGLSRTSFHRAIQELLELEFIKKTRFQGQYEVNPNIIFNGKKKAND